MGEAAGPERAGTIEVDVVAYGRPATAALAARIAAAKRHHPLDPVTVVVPSNIAGLAARRVLGAATTATTGETGHKIGSPEQIPCPGSGGAGAGNATTGGLANVNFVTPFALAELIGGPALAGRLPLTNPAMAAAIRHVLAEAPDIFEPVAAHQATHAAVASVYDELSRVSEATLDAIAAASTRSRGVVNVVRAVKQSLSQYYDEDELAAAATARVSSDPSAAAALGAVVWHLPGRTTPAMTALLRAVMAHAASAAAVVALTGDGEADAAVRDVCRAAGVDIPEANGISIIHADRIFNVTDPDEEVRTVVREIMALAESGTPLDRIAVAYPRSDPYARTLAEQLAGAGVPFNGPSTKRLAASVTGRALLAALALPATGWHRGDVMALVDAAPLWDPTASKPARTNRWDRATRRGGVVAGLDDWRTKLARRVAELRAAQEEASTDPDPDVDADRREARVAAIGWDIEAAEAVLAFVERLASRLAELEAATTWRDRAQQARALLDLLVGPEHTRRGWPDDEIDAAQKVDAALTRLASLDVIEPNSTSAAFELALAAELRARTRRQGRFGTGVLVTPLAAAVGLDVDAVFVVGLAEGDCPWFRAEDSLLPDADRALAAPGELTTRADLLGDQHRAFLAAVAAGRVHRTLLFPRGDLRSRRDRIPSRWLLETASHHAGRPVRSSDFARIDVGVVTLIPSFAAGIVAATTHGTIVERDTAMLAVHAAAGAGATTHPLATGPLGRGLICQQARSGAAFTEWDGNLSGHGIPSPVEGVMSASRLETWAKCALKYYLANVLRLAERDDPDRIDEISVLDKGTLIHSILERFIGEVIRRPAGPPKPTEKWTDADRARMVELANEEFVKVARKGRTGRPLAWRRTQMNLLADLDTFLTEDDNYRAANSMVPVAVEMPFGLNGVAPLELMIPDGRVVKFRGLVDRVDKGLDGRVSVLDYKSSKADSYKGLADDPVEAGTTLQLGLYAEAAMAQGHGTAVTAEFWLATSRGDFKRVGYQWSGERVERFVNVVGTMVEGIESGLFPANPGEYDAFWGSHANCGFCDFNRVCPRDRDDHQRAKEGAPELRLLDRLLPDQDADDDVPGDEYG